MAELCGPSNALANFQKHSSVDRTLQQDKFSPIPIHKESFKSPPGPNAGFLDAEFEAFQASTPFDPGFEEPQLYTPSSRPQADSQIIDWAADFQQLHVHETPHVPLPSASFRHHAPLHTRSTSPWRDDFLSRQRREARSSDTPLVRDVYSPTTQSQYASQHVDSQGYANPAAFAARDASQEVSVQDDDELFSKAFERVEADVRVNEEMIFGGLFVSQERPAVCEDPSLSQPRIGSDRILDESQQKDDINHDGKDDSDELARTAGKLLENVKDDTSKKFAGSNFLSLMRQLRDREVRIENDHFVDALQPLHPGGRNYPQDSPSSHERSSVQIAP